MGSLEKDIPYNQSVPTDAQEEAHLADEINLIGYFRVVWKHKYLILLGSVLPALLVALILFFWPRKFKVTYIYDVGLDEKGYKVLLDKFYSGENLDKIVVKLKANDLDKYAQEIAEAERDEDLREIVNFEVLPSYFETIDVSKTTVIEDLQKIQQVRGTLLAMTITGEPKEEMQIICSIMRDDFEKVIPIYLVKHGLNETIGNFKANTAEIEQSRFGLELELATKKATLAKLKNLKPEDLDKVPGDIVIHFNNVGGNSAYLPLAYQIQATESQIIGLEENIRANQEKYDYYKGLLSLNERLFDQVKDKTSIYYTIGEFHSFLTSIVNNYEKKELTDYLNAYIKRIENRISSNIPVIEKPKVYPVPKGTAKKSTLVFAICLMILIFAAFLSEGSRKSEAQAS